MDQRYQIFISSTYSDLKDEREIVMKTVIRKGHFPAGMEHWPAADEDQFEFIKRVIDRSDYYIVVIAGRYGTLAPDGLSYTEKEFDYAREKDLKVIALVHGDPGSIRSDLSEEAPESREKLKAFRKKAESGRLRATWKTPHELAYEAMAAIDHATETYPAIGWVRGNQVIAPEVLSKLIEAQTEVTKLKEELAGLKATQDDGPLVHDVEGWEAVFDIFGNVVRQGEKVDSFKISLTWFDILSRLLKIADKSAKENVICDEFSYTLLSHYDPEFDPVENNIGIQIDRRCWEAIAKQARAQNLVKVYMYTWSLTPRGEKYLLLMTAIRKKPADT